MGWQQFLNNSSVPLKQRLHGAHVAFLASSQELSTQQKEDVVILWLTRLVKEKQMSAWQDDTDCEQEQVWRLLDQLFSSQRLQQLVRKAWTCPITTAFPQSIIDVLGAPKLGAATRRLVVSTACAIITNPAVAVVITNSTTLSLQITTALLDAAIDASWAQVETERQQRLHSKDAQPGLAQHLPDVKRYSSGRQPEQGQSASNSALLHDEKVLKALSVILDDVASQLLVKNDDAAVKFCCQQLLKRMVSLELAAEAYNGSPKFVLLDKLEKLIKDSLFNVNVSSQYTTFLSFLNVEDCKAFSEVSLIPVVLSSVSAIMSSGHPQAAARAVSLFFEGFLHQFHEDEHRVRMLACLLHMAGVTLPGDVISCHSEALEFIERMPLAARAQESIIVTLMRPLQSLGKTKHGSRVNTYLALLLQHLTAQPPLSCDWFLAMRCLLTMLPEDHEELHTSLGEVLTANKPDERSLNAVSDLLDDLLQHHTSTAGPVAFISVLLRSIVAKKDKLKSHKEMIPFTSSPDHTDLRVLVPARFLHSLSLVLGSSEPLVFCDLLSSLLRCATDLLLPLVSAADDGSGRAMAGCCWVLSAVLGGACPSRVASVQQFAADVARGVVAWAEQLVDPLLRGLHSHDKLDQARCSGALLLCHAFVSLLHDLRRCDAFVEAWQATSAAALPSFVPHTSPLTWAFLVSSVEVCSDVTTRSLLLRLVLLMLQHLHAEDKRSVPCAVVKAPPHNRAPLSPGPTSPSKGQAHHIPPSEAAAESHHELIASLCGTFKKILDNSSAKDAPKLVRDLLCDNLLPSLHVVPSCHKAVAKYVLSAYITNSKLVQRAVLEQANLAALVPQLVQSALGRLAAAIKSDSPAQGAAGKRKRNGEEGQQEKGAGLNVKGKKRKLEDGGASQGKNESEDDSSNQKLPEEIINDENNSCDDLFAIFQTVTIRLHCLEKGDDKKRILKDSVKMKQHLGRIVDSVTEGRDVTAVQYNDHDAAAQICNFFLDMKLSALSVAQVVVVLQAFMALFLLTRIDDKKHKKILVSLLRCINVCFEALPVEARIVPAQKLAALATRLVEVRSQPSLVHAAARQRAASKHTIARLDSSLIVHFDTTLNLVVRQLVQWRGAGDALGPVAECLMRSAGKPSAQEHLHTAWTLVSHCGQAAREGSDQHTSHCRAAVSTLALWAMPAASPHPPQPYSAFYILSMYSELLAIELGRPDKEGREAPRQGSGADGGVPNGTRDACDEVTSRDVENGELGDDTEEVNEDLEVNPSIENNASADEAGDRPYLDHLSAAWRLAQFCLSCRWAPLQSCGLQFLLRLKRLAPRLRPQCTDEDIFRALRGFLQQEMSAVPPGEGAEVSPCAEHFFHLPISLTKRADVSPSADLAAQNKDALTEFLRACPVETYRDLLGSLLGRSLGHDGVLAPRTLGLWQLLLAVDVSSVEGRRAKRAAVRTLTQLLARHLQGASGPREERSPQLSAEAMVAALELLTSVMKQPLSLPHQTVLQVLTAATAPTRHLDTAHFVLVWQKQVTLLHTALMSRTGAWPGRAAGLLSALLSLVTALAQRSSAYSQHAHAHKEALTSCCLSMEQLLRKLHPLHRDLHHILHLTAGSVIAALQQHNVIPPVRSVLDTEVYKLLKVCDPKGLDHLAVALPTRTRPLLHHYRNNFNKYYAVDHTKE